MGINRDNFVVWNLDKMIKIHTVCGFFAKMVF